MPLETIVLLSWVASVGSKQQHKTKAGTLESLVWKNVVEKTTKNKKFTDCGDRTRDHEIKSLALYQAELNRRCDIEEM